MALSPDIEAGCTQKHRSEDNPIGASVIFLLPLAKPWGAQRELNP